MNKEVEEAKEIIKATLYGNEYLERITFYTSDIKVLLNYIQELEKYDSRKICIDNEDKLHSLAFTKEQLELMNMGIAIYKSFDELFKGE